jgi:hypothetical protein
MNPVVAYLRMSARRSLFLLVLPATYPHQIDRPIAQLPDTNLFARIAPLGDILRKHKFPSHPNPKQVNSLTRAIEVIINQL